MKKIILNSNIIWTITQFRKDLIIELTKDYSVICIASKDEFSKKSLDIIEQLGVEFIEVNVDRKGINPFSDLKYLIQLFFLYKKIKPDLIIHYTIKPNIYGSIASGLLNIKSFSVISGLGSSFIKNNFLTKFIKKLYRFSLKSSNKVLFLNQDDMDIFLNHNLIRNDQSLLLPGEGVDIDYYKNCKYNKKITFLMIGRLLKDKGIYEYIDAIKKLNNKNIKFLLAGVLDSDNPTSIEKKELDSWVEKGIIDYLGTTDNIKDFFALANVIVLPSYREGLSRVLLEACSCEKFIITTNIAGCKELCTDNMNGFLCEPRNSESLKNSIEETISLGMDEIALRGKESRKIVEENYSNEIVNNIYRNLIKETI